MTQPKSEWQTKELATSYLAGVRGAIPGADLQLAVIGKIVQIWGDAPTRILDLGCGDGILGRLLLDIFPSTHGVFVDFSAPMLEALRQKASDMSRMSIIQADFGSSQWLDDVTSYKPFDIVISGFSIHHQPDTRKRDLYAEIYELLSPGGLFLNMEHIASATPAGVPLFDEFFIDHLYDFHAKSDPQANRVTIADTYYNRPDKAENILAPVEAQCEWLREIGFRDVDCFFKLFELALFGGRKVE